MWYNCGPHSTLYLLHFFMSTALIVLLSLFELEVYLRSHTKDSKNGFLDNFDKAALKLENCVVVNNYWLRILTFLTHMIFTNVPQSLKLTRKKTRNNNASMSLYTFVNRLLAHKCLHNNYNEEVSCNLPTIIRQARLPTITVAMDGIT